MRYYWEATCLAQVKGRDAERYLNARLSNNIKTLKLGDSLQAAALSPVGKTDLLVEVLRITAEEFILVCNGINFSDFKTRLEQFKVADRFDTVDLSSSHTALFICSEENHSSHAKIIQDEINNSNASGILALPGWQECALVISSKEAIQSLVKREDLQLASEQDILRIRTLHKAATFPAEINDKFLFSEADRSLSISNTKGCYVGQEVVEKASARGQTAFCLMHFSSSLEDQTAPTQGMTIMHNQERAGEVITVFCDEQTKICRGFARIKRTYAQAGQTLNVDGLTLTLNKCQAG